MRVRGLPGLLLLLALPVTLLTAVPSAVPPAAAAAGDPIGRLDDATSPAEGKLRMRGWAADPDGPTTAIRVGVFVDNDFVVGIDANKPSPGLGYFYPGYSNDHGYEVEIDLAPGEHWVCAWGINIAATPGTNAIVGCKTVKVQGPPPDTTIIGSERRADGYAFLFESSPPGSTFECQWDGGPWSGCVSPLAAVLPSGLHTFAVRAVDEWGKADPTPAVEEFAIPVVQGPPLTDSALVLGVKAVKRKSKLKVSVRPRSSEKDYVFTVQKKRKQKWKKVTRVRTSGPRDTKVLNLPRGRYRVVIKNQHGLVGTISQTVRLKR